MEIFVIAMLVNGVLAVFVSYAASQRGRSVLGFFFFSLLFSFLIGILVLMALPPVDADEEDQRDCPKCLSKIPLQAVKCKFCQSGIDEPATQSQTGGEIFWCKKCSNDYKAQELEDSNCPVCDKTMILL